MSINHNVAMRRNPSDESQPKRAYAKAQMKEKLSLQALSQRIAHETTVSRVDIMSVLTSTSEEIVESLIEGHQVDFDGPGRFRVEPGRGKR